VPKAKRRSGSKFCRKLIGIQDYRLNKFMEISMVAHAGEWSAFNAFGIQPKIEETLEERLLWLADKAAAAAREGGEEYELIVYALKKMLCECRAIYLETHSGGD
jgi:hypothetical protein